MPHPAARARIVRLRPRAVVALVAPFLLIAGFAGCSGERSGASGPPVGDGAAAVGDLPSPSAVAAGSDRAIETIAMVGDSITRGSERALRTAFDELGVEVAAIDAADGRRLTVDGLVGSGVGAVDRVDVVTDPDLWIVALGTNDIALYSTDEEYRAAIDEVLDELPDEDVPLVWVDVHIDGNEQRCRDFNDTLRMALAARGNATVAEWSLRATDDGVLSDGLHPGDDGAEVFADLVADGVALWRQ